MQLDNRAYEFMKQAKQQGISKEEVFSLLQSKGYDLGLNDQPAPQQTAQPSQDNYSALDKAKYIGRAAGEGLTFGLGDIVGGITNTLVAPIGKTVNTIREGAPITTSDFNPIQNFKEGRGDFVREQQQFAQEHPVLNFGGELGGGLITGAVGAGKKLITAAGKQGLKALANEGAREGAKFGLAYGAGSGLTQDTEKLSVSNALKGGAEGLITGAALGAAVPVAVTGTGRGVQRFLGTKGYAQRAADEIFKEAGGKEIGQVVRTEKGTRALKEAIKADDKVARAVRDVSDQKLIDSADKTKDIINNTLGVDNIVNARNQARAFYDDVVNNSTTKIPQSIYSNKGTQEALAKAIAEDYSGELAKKGPNSLAVAQKAKEKLDDMIEASYEIGDYGVRKPTSKTQDLIAVKNAFVKQLDAIAPEYKMARDQFTKAVKPYDLLEGLTKTTGRERANTIKSVLTNKNKEAISSVFGKEKAGQLFDTLRSQSIENERFNKLYNAAENQLTKENPKTQGLVREALESFGSIVGNAVDMARLGGATRGRRRIGEILLGMGEKEATRPNLSVSGILANKLKEKGGYAMKEPEKLVTNLNENEVLLKLPQGKRKEFLDFVDKDSNHTVAFSRFSEMAQKLKNKLNAKSINEVFEKSSDEERNMLSDALRNLNNSYSEAYEKFINPKNLPPKAFYNGIKLGKQLVKGHWSKGGHVEGDDIITFYAREYKPSDLEKYFNVRNNTDTMTDYFDKDKIDFRPGDKFYKQALEAFNAQTSKRNRKSISQILRNQEEK